jgi:hypothetical protein
VVELPARENKTALAARWRAPQGHDTWHVPLISGARLPPAGTGPRTNAGGESARPQSAYH